MKRLGCVGFIFVLMLAVIGYQQWRIHVLETKIASIATKVHAGKGTGAAKKNTDLASTIAQAQAYTQQAQKFMSDKNFKQAESELKKAKAKLETANAFSKNIYANSAEFLGKAKTRTEKVFQEAWKDIQSEPKPKSESGKQKPYKKTQ